MDALEISAAVITNTITGEILLMVEPDRMPADISPYRIVGYFRVRADGETVFDTPDKNGALLMGVALPAFAEHVAKVKKAGDAIDWLERLHSLEVKD
jgi:hypothetical protein